MKWHLWQEKGVTAGPNFYDLPRTNITSDLKADMRLLQMRSMLDPRRHYKKRPEATIPKYSQMGTIIQGRTEYFSSRLPKGKHRRTFLEEVLTNETSTGHLRKRYNEIQASKTSGRKAFYKRLKDKRSSRTCKRWGPHFIEREPRRQEDFAAEMHHIDLCQGREVSHEAAADSTLFSMKTPVLVEETPWPWLLILPRYVCRTRSTA